MLDPADVDVILFFVANNMETRPPSQPASFRISFFPFFSRPKKRLLSWATFVKLAVLTVFVVSGEREREREGGKRRMFLVSPPPLPHNNHTHITHESLWLFEPKKKKKRTALLVKGGPVVTTKTWKPGLKPRHIAACHGWRRYGAEKAWLWLQVTS